MGFDFDTLLTEVRKVYHVLRLNNYSVSSCLRQSKSNAKSIALRNRGNLDFKLGKNDEALFLYTESIAVAVEDSEEQALALANRSAVLYQLGKYRPCLHDINRALKGKYPEKMKEKLADRKRRCLMAMRSGNEQGLDIPLEEDELDPIDYRNDKFKWHHKLNNPYLLNASPKVAIACNEQWGRYLVATKDIDPGELLSCQEFFVSTVAPKRLFRNCSHCFHRSDALIPCSTCCEAMYCSVACRTHAFESYHRIECKLLAFYERESLSANDIMAVRALLVGTMQGTRVEDWMEHFQNDRKQNIFEDKYNAANKVYPSDYQCVLKMKWKFESIPKRHILLATKAIVMLRGISFFGDNLSDSLDISEKELITGLLLINHLDSMQYSFIVRGMPESWNRNAIPNDEESSIGLGVCPLHELMNHSCDPNTIYAFRRREQLLFSVRPIKRGEQVFIAYCLPFAACPKVERQNILRSTLQGFQCSCEACHDDWPPLHYLRFQTPEVASINPHIMQKIRKGMNIFDKAPTSTDLEDLLRYRKMLHSKLRNPSEVIVLCESSIHMVLMRLYDVAT